jgi:hypothetical protein
MGNRNVPEGVTVTRRVRRGIVPCQEFLVQIDTVLREKSGLCMIPCPGKRYFPGISSRNEILLFFVFAFEN